MLVFVLKIVCRYMTSLKLFLSLFACAFLTIAQQKPLPAFPEAEGFGSTTIGGRGGKVYVVTNLDDDGPGSFRAACRAPEPRIIVFAVSGLIDLKKPITITEPYCTIAGQTAPGEGLCLMRSEFKVCTHDVVVRFLRSRPGDIAGKEYDAMGIGDRAYNVIFDHCSATWSVDECLSPSGAIHDITVQWCLIGESLNNSVHHKGEHGYGSLVRAVGGLTMHHNLWVDNISRNPRLGDNYGEPPYPTFDIRNNVVYNWGQVCSGLTGDNLSANYIGNYLRPGPNSSKRPPIVLTKSADVTYYIEDNEYEGTPEFTAVPSAMFTCGEKEEPHFKIASKPFDAPRVNTTTAKEAYKQVLALVGAICPIRDMTDASIINEVKANKGRIIDSQKDVGGWGLYSHEDPPQDSDGDGIPDAWEIAHGLDPKNPDDAAALAKDNSGYTNIEVYINEIATRTLLANRPK
jgi:hypothetical protein